MATDEKQAAQAKLNARTAELKQCVGKMYRQKAGGDRPGATFKVLGYLGVKQLADGSLAHIFKVERFNPGAIYTPPASKFLEQHEELTAKE